MDDNKSKALAAALAQIEKQFGKGSIMRLGDGEAVEAIEAVSTGSLGLDIALGIGGLPRGRVVEIYGPESSGKTTLALHAIADPDSKIQNLARGQTYVSLTDGKSFLRRESTSAGRGAYDRSRMTLNAIDLLRTALLEGMNESVSNV